ncbi:MAG: hypothetical protein FWD25_00375 [Clostridia bacterium]|nr:hypothetical protein [Clostridia bacterium]
MKKIGAISLCLLLCMVYLPQPRARACIFPEPVMRVSASSGGNEKAVKIRSGKPARDWTEYAITQTAMPFVKVLPDGKASVPLTVGIKFYSEHKHDGKVTRDRERINGFKEAAVADPAVSTQNEVLYIALDLSRTRNLEYSVHKLVYVGGVVEYGNIRFNHNWNGYSIQNDLTLTLPETPGITIDPASTPEHLILRLATGTPLPAVTAFKAELAGKNVRVQNRLGFFAQGRSKTFLPVSDEEILVQYPELADTCLLTFMVFNKREKTTHYAIVEGRWD